MAEEFGPQWSGSIMCVLMEAYKLFYTLGVFFASYLVSAQYRDNFFKGLCSILNKDVPIHI